MSNLIPTALWGWLTSYYSHVTNKQKRTSEVRWLVLCLPLRKSESLIGPRHPDSKLLLLRALLRQSLQSRSWHLSLMHIVIHPNQRASSLGVFSYAFAEHVFPLILKFVKELAKHRLMWAHIWPRYLLGLIPQAKNIPHLECWPLCNTVNQIR